MKKEVKFPLETENYKFFQHKDCEFFPCHDDVDENEFNCLFCYCPLYCLGEDCRGNFVILDNGCKDCSNCNIPHQKDNYSYVNGEYEKIVELFKRK